MANFKTKSFFFFANTQKLCASDFIEEM
uniref:Uncharacterized protein n=1 Tax=Arundo donax TaxID=35708 RepID=A0A0A9HH52_ARUDO